jgi:uncharacterized delta-60 repeat protein
MNVTAFAKWTGTLLLVLTLGACGGGGDDHGGTGTQPAGTVVGAAGGTVLGPNGVTIVIPPGALATDITIRIEESSVGAPQLPVGFTVRGPMYALTPHGTTFAVPVTLTLPFDAASVPTGSTPAFFKTNALNEWEEIGAVTIGANTMVAQISSFSSAQPGFKAITLVSTDWEWEFQVLESHRESFVTLPGPDGSGAQSSTQGVLDRFLQNFGAAHFDRPVQTSLANRGGILQPADKQASGLVQATQDGVTFGVFTEAPYEHPTNRLPRLGSTTRLLQKQSFKKTKGAASASLTFTVTKIELETTDFNNIDGNNADLLEPHRTALAISGEVSLAILAYTDARGIIYDGKATAYVSGNGTIWNARAFNDAGTRNKLWNSSDFTATQTDIQFPLPGVFTCLGTGVSVKFNQPRSYVVDLSAVGDDEVIFVEVTSEAKAQNRRGAQSDTSQCAIASASAYLKDPQEIGGTSMTFVGLEPTNERRPAPPRPALVAPAACPAPTPDAGILQFEAANFVIGEFEGSVPTVAVTRTGGSRGEVSATIATSDGTAAGGTDYQPLTATVFFADGDTDPRLVRVTPIQNDAGAADKSVNLTLSQPGGCATLGALSTARLIIRDNVGTVTPPTTFSIGGQVNGLAGSGLVLEDLGREVAIAANGAFAFPLQVGSGSPYVVRVKTQPVNPNQVCVVTRGAGVVANGNITDIAVDCSTPPPNGSLDPTFGSGGKVSTAFGGDDTAMALQADGKIVMVGGSGADFLLARYNLDATLDTSFGAGGLVTSDVGVGSADEARAVAIQADGKIVVAGNAVVGRTSNNQFNFDFALARFNADGSPDLSFGSGGKVTTDFNGQTDRAFALAIQGDGKIVVAGSAAPASGISTDFAVARYDSAGAPDGTFGSGGKLTTDIGGAIDIAQNIVVQPNGAILVSGVMTLGPSPVLGHAGLARYDAIGNPDNSFGTAGKLTLPNLALGEALALQADGRIVIAGSAPVGGRSAFAVMRLGANGAIELSFGSSGLATAAFSIEDDFARAVLVQADGRIVVAGQSSNRINPDFAVTRFADNGALDASFGSGGKLTIDFFGSFDGAENVAVQPDGKLVVGGFATNGSRTGYGLVRILP